MATLKGLHTFVDWSDERRGDARRQCTSIEAVVEEAGEKGGQDPCLETTAIFHGDMAFGTLAYSSLARQPAPPTTLPLDSFGGAS